MGQNAIWDASCPSASQEIPCILCNLRILHHFVHNNPPAVPYHKPLFSPPPPACHILQPYHSTWYDHPNKMCVCIYIYKIIKLLLSNFCIPMLPPLRPNYLPQHPWSTSFTHVSDQASHTSHKLQFSLYIFGQQMARQKILDQMATSISWISSSCDFLQNVFFICQGCSQTSELRNVFKGFTSSYFYMFQHFISWEILLMTVISTKEYKWTHLWKSFQWTGGSFTNKVQCIRCYVSVAVLAHMQLWILSCC